MKSNSDAKKTADLNNGTFVAVDVEGLTLSSLVRNVMLPFQPRARSQEEKASGGLLMIKMDIEGAEYQVLKEISSSGILCDYIAMGNKVIMIVEFHVGSITDPNELEREQAGAEQAKMKLEDCGVEFGLLDANWY